MANFFGGGDTTLNTLQITTIASKRFVDYFHTNELRNLDDGF